MKPRLEEIEKEYPWLETINYDYDTNVTEVRKWDVSDFLPTFIFIDKLGNEITRVHGEKSKDILIKIIEDNKDM
jgi:tartrate dehydratase beta subunit/fumarate hydratase class I family protein